MKPAALPNQTKSNWPSMPCGQLASGGVFDKLTVLELNAQRLAGPGQLANVARERCEIEVVVAALAAFRWSCPGS